MFHISIILEKKKNKTNEKQPTKQKQQQQTPPKPQTKQKICLKILGKHLFLTENINFQSALGLYIFLAG